MRLFVALFLMVCVLFELTGWAVGSDVLIGNVYGLTPTHPSTAAVFGLAAISVWFFGRKSSVWKRRFGVATATMVSLAGIARLIGYWMGAPKAVDEFLFHDMVVKVAAAVEPTPFQMSVKTSFSFAMIGIAMLIVHLRRKLRFGAFLLIIATALLSLLTITSHLFLDVGFLQRTGINSPMAIATSCTFLMLVTVVAVELTDWPCDATGYSRSRRSQENKIAGGFAAAVFTLCGVGIFSYQSISQFIIDARWDNQSYQVLAAINQLSAGLKDTEGLGRGYIISGDTEFLDQRPAALKDIDESMKSLRLLTADHASQQRRLDELEPLIALKVVHANTLIQLRRDSGFDSARQLVSTGRGRVLMHQISALLDSMRFEENSLLAARSVGTEANAHRGMALISIGSTLSLVLVSLAAWMLYRDTDARSRAADALQASYTLYRGLLECAPVAIVIVDPVGKIELVNAQAERMFGYTAVEMRGQPVEMIMPATNPNDPLTQRNPFFVHPAVVEMGATKQLRGVRKDGAEFSVEISLSPMQTANGPRISSAMVDISARKQQEREMAQLNKMLLDRTVQLEASDEELRHNMERFRSLVESAKEYAIFMLDSEGRVKTWNIGAQRIKGYTAEEIIGKHFSIFYSAEERANGKPERELETAIREGQFEEDGWRWRADGSRFKANVMITPVRNHEGVVIGFSKITRDLTERIRAEEQAKNFFTLSLELLCIAGKDGYFKRLNASWQTTLGYTVEEMCSARYMDFVHPDDREQTVIAAEKLARGDSHGQFENRYRCKDGSYRWLLWKSAVSSDSELIYAAATDITERKKVEDEIVELNKTLQRQNSRLATANKELESFSYSVSHDLRAPLRSIDGFSQAILEDYGDKLDEEAHDHLRRVRAASQRMGQLIDDLLNLSRVARGEMRHELTDLSQIAHEVADECCSVDTERNVKIIIADNLAAEADPRLMRVVFTNLLGNAWKFTSKKPLAVIEVGCCTENGQSEYFVRDNGAGFDMAYVGNLFGAFQRLHSENDFPGTGIGLATVQRIVHRHGGRVRAQSKSGEGATFYFTL